MVLNQRILKSQKHPVGSQFPRFLLAGFHCIFLAEFAETMFLLTGDLGIFDKAIGEDPVSHAIAQQNSTYPI